MLFRLLPVGECGWRTSCPCNRSCSSWGNRPGVRHHSGLSSVWNYSTLGFHNRARHTGQPGHQKMYSGTRWGGGEMEISPGETGNENWVALGPQTWEAFYNSPCVWRHAVKWRCASAPSLIEGSAGSTGAPGKPSSSADCVPNQHTAASTETRSSSIVTFTLELFCV